MEVLLIHTGGTIGMVETELGLAPRNGMVEAAVTAGLPDGIALVSKVFDPLLDSADVGPDHWNLMLDWIEESDARTVLITHGTDTMAYTGAALSQALFDVDKRVIMCGAMMPLGQGGDAEGNLSLALNSLHGDAGVYLAFGGRLLPAAGLVKHETHAADSFRSVPQVLTATAQQRFDPELRAAILTLSPAMPAAMLGAALGHLDAAVLRVFGAGTAMNDDDVMTALADAISRGVKIRAVSAAETGGLTPGSYAAGAGLWATGVQNGGVETAEAALVRLWLS